MCTFLKVEELNSLQREGDSGVEIHSFSRHLDGSGLLVEKLLLLSSCFLLSIETVLLWFCHSNIFSLSFEMQLKIWLCSEILISVFLHASYFNMLCKPVVTATSVGSGLYFILKKNHWLEADWSSWPDICQKYI